MLTALLCATTRTIAEWGDNSLGQTNAPSVSQVKLIACGAYQTIISIFSYAHYQIDVGRDLLLIYNTNSPASSNICNYYLANRPMVAGANVLPIGLSPLADDRIEPTAFTDEILTPFLQWLTNNPTKRPQYIILFPDIPSPTCLDLNCDNDGSQSVQQALRDKGSFRLVYHPFVTAINMGLFDNTNDCIAYIDKLKTIGATYSPGRLLISPYAAGYGNTNYYIDASDDAPGNTPGRNATNGIFMANPTASVTYTNVMDSHSDLVPHIHTGSNVAGYLCFGAHSALGFTYATNASEVAWTGNSKWWIIHTIESYNGLRKKGDSSQGFFLQYFSTNWFGGTAWSNTPIGATTTPHEPGAVIYDSIYYGLWESGRNFGMCAWGSANPSGFFLQIIGDPFVRKSHCNQKIRTK